MRIEYIANAGFVITLGTGATVLCDPWFVSPCGFWFNFPPVPAAAQARLAALRPTCLYISHIHGDHLHGPTLALYDRATPVLIGAMRTPHLKQALAGLGFTDVRELSFHDVHPLPGGGQCAIFPDFQGSTAGHPRRLDYDLDTALWLWDADGTSVFNAVDNTITADDARDLVARFGHPTVAILQSGSASLYPMAMVGYPPERRRAERDRLAARFIDRFCALARIFDAARVIPAAGEYVVGGPAAALNAFLPHPTFADLARRWGEAGLPAERFCKLWQGDVLDAATLTVTRNPAAAMRDFTADARETYARSLADAAALPPHDPAFPWPAFPWPAFPWADALERAAAAFHRARRRIGYAADADVELVIGSPQVPPASPGPVLVGRLPLDADGWDLGPAQETPRRAVTRFHLSRDLMQAILTRRMNWNGGEAAWLIGLEREPDVYDPTLHGLMMAFVPPRAAAA